MKKRKRILTSQFDYFLPPKLIAQKPIKPRDQARLLILNKKDKTIVHKRFYQLAEELKAGDVLVLNDSKVIPARLLGQKETGGKTEIFLLKKEKGKTWQCLIGGKIKTNQTINLPQNIEAQPQKQLASGIWLVDFNASDKKLFAIGQTPLPPYIKQRADLADYQTVYAKDSGSVAAPTAGLHFTKELLKKLKRKGVQIEYVTLHVGLGTFQPVKAEYIDEHQMHAELATINGQTARRLNQAKKQNRKIIAVGTTVARTLEAFASQNRLQAKSDWINIFIYPGYKFKFVDAIITNFHLPKSTLLMLIAAFANLSLIKRAYQSAIKNHYRFYSFGDAMLIK